MIQIYADGGLVYDSRLRVAGKDYTLLGLTITKGLNKGGTAVMRMRPGHPIYSRFIGHRTVVEIFQDGLRKFRGRALYPSDDWVNCRTWTCEGELCFFQDGTSRPYLYQDTPAAIFTAVVEGYNSQVEAFKRFKVGTITVTDPNDYVRLESETAEQTLDTLNKLIDRCGGYITFTTDPDTEERVVNWYAEIGARSTQSIEFGKNLLDFARTGSNTGLATVIIPYGAQDATTGKRVDITSVNGGLDYIQDDEAVALRGSISKPVYWDDVTDPANLLKKAQEYLYTSRNVVTSLTLTAVDLSKMDKSIDSFQLGDYIPVVSKPHAVDDYFRLTDYTEDLLKPDNSQITLGADVKNLTYQTNAEGKAATKRIQSATIDLKNRAEAIINGLKVGARNYLQKSNPADWIEEWLRWGTNTTANVEDGWLQVIHGGEDASYGYLPPKISTFPAGDLILSFDAYSDTTTELNYNYIMGQEGNTRIGRVDITSTPTRYTIPIHRDTDLVGCSIMLGSTTGDSFYVRDIKVELGKVPTGWTPAPEDIGFAIDSEAEVIHQTILEQRTEVLNTAQEYTVTALENYVEVSTYEKFRESTESELKQTADQIELNFEQTTQQITNVNGDLLAISEVLEKHFEFNANGLTIKAGEGSMNLILDNDIIRFVKNGQEFGWWDGVDFHTGNIIVEVNERAQFGNFAFIPRSNGSLSFLKVGG